MDFKTPIYSLSSSYHIVESANFCRFLIDLIVLNLSLKIIVYFSSLEINLGPFCQLRMCWNVGKLAITSWLTLILLRLPMDVNRNICRQMWFIGSAKRFEWIVACVGRTSSAPSSRPLLGYPQDRSELRIQIQASIFWVLIQPNVRRFFSLTNPWIY